MENQKFINKDGNLKNLPQGWRIEKLSQGLLIETFFRQMELLKNLSEGWKSYREKEHMWGAHVSNTIFFDNM